MVRGRDARPRENQPQEHGDCDEQDARACFDRVHDAWPRVRGDRQQWLKQRIAASGKG